MDAVSACGVPRHADEQGPVVAVIGRPPVLRQGHQRIDVLCQSIEVEAHELLGVVELLAVGIGLGVVLAEDPQVQLVRPPMLVRRGADSLVGRAHHRALGCGVHFPSDQVPNSPAPFGSVPLSAGIRSCSSCMHDSPQGSQPRKGAPREAVGGRTCRVPVRVSQQVRIVLTIPVRRRRPRRTDSGLRRLGRSFPRPGRPHAMCHENA